MTPQLSIAHYRVTSKLGEGGMGAVYRATDTKLGRDVAIKVLPDAVANDPERLTRFTREAQVLAALNHPNIAQIYGVEETGETRALVMELVPGSMLSIPQPLDTALDYARQIADGLEAAHQKGITHRDLKPGNIMVTPDGVVKILDFGLATVPGREAPSNPAQSPTFTMAATQAGVIMGTAAYMSPEQAAGRPVDHRSDIWSFGVVLWELLTGAQLFAGETISHTLADVLRAPLDFDKLPASTPRPVAELLHRCLDRNVKTRLQAIGEARIALQKYREDPRAGEKPATAPMAPSRSSPAGWIVAAALAITAGALGYIAFRHSQEAPPAVVKAYLMPPENTSFADNSPPALSPDGRKLAFVALQQGNRQLWIRDLDSLNARSLTGTEGAMDPFWSPDGQSIGFAADGRLKRIDLASGTIQTLCATEGNVYGASWSSRGVIVFPASQSSGLFRVSSSGGTPAPVTTLDRNAGEVSHRLVWFLPDGRHFFFSVRNREQSNKSAVYIGDLDSSQRILLMQQEAQAVYIPGFLVFATMKAGEVAVTAQAFDTSSLRTTGDPFLVTDAVNHTNTVWGQQQFTLSAGGVLVYANAGSFNRAQLTWVDRSGKLLGRLGTPGTLATAAISPDGSKVATENASGGGQDVWIHDLARGTFSRLTFNSAGAGAIMPAWAADGKSVYFGHYDGAVRPTPTKMLLGGGEMLQAGSPWDNPPRPVQTMRCSPDGKYLIATLGPAGNTGSDLWFLPLNQPGEKPQPYLGGTANESRPSFSPTSDWVAYSSDETRRFEVYVQSFPQPGRKFQVSVNGGSTPVWSRDGRELFFIAPDRQMMAASVQKKGDGLEIGIPKALFDSHLAPTANSSFDVTKDGRFLIPMQEDRSDFPLTLVLNWQAGVKK